MGSKHEDESSSERSARLIVEQFLNVQFEFTDLKGQVDYICFDKEAPLIALEVTNSTDARKTELANTQLAGHGYIETNLVKSNWIITIKGVPRYSKIKKDLIPKIRDLEMHGIDQIYMHTQSWWLEGVPTLKSALSVFKENQLEAISSRIGEFKNQDFANSRFIVVSSTENWTYGGVNNGLRFFEEFANSSTNDHRKLLDSNCESRHLFIWVDENNLMTTRAIFDDDQLSVPTRVLILEHAITDLWIADKVTSRALYFDSSKKWHHINF